jgi:hypothetical protein
MRRTSLLDRLTPIQRQRMAKRLLGGETDADGQVVA